MPLKHGTSTTVRLVFHILQQLMPLCIFYLECLAISGELAVSVRRNKGVIKNFLHTFLFTYDKCQDTWLGLKIGH